MRLELTRVGLLVELTNHYTTRGAYSVVDDALNFSIVVRGSNSSPVISFTLELVSLGTYKTPYILSYGLNSCITVLLHIWIGKKITHED